MFWDPSQPGLMDRELGAPIYDPHAATDKVYDVKSGPNVSRVPGFSTCEGRGLQHLLNKLM